MSRALSCWLIWCRAEFYHWQWRCFVGTSVMWFSLESVTRPVSELLGCSGDVGSGHGLVEIDFESWFSYCTLKSGHDCTVLHPTEENSCFRKSSALIHVQQHSLYLQCCSVACLHAVSATCCRRFQLYQPHWYWTYNRTTQMHTQYSLWVRTCVSVSCMCLTSDCADLSTQ